MLLKRDTNLFNNCRLQFNLPPLDLNIIQPEEYLNAINEMRNIAFAFINANDGELPAITFPEFHPYTDTYPLDNELHIYIIGTFPPISYLLDNLAINENFNFLQPPFAQVIKRPDVSFYHGSQCELWKIVNENLRNQINDNALRREDKKNCIIRYLQNRRINYFDVISTCQRNMYNANDSNLYNIQVNSSGIMSILNCLNQPLLIFNSSSTFSFTGLKFSRLGIFKPQNNAFDIFLSIVKNLGYFIEFSFDNQLTWLTFDAINSNVITQLSIYKLIFYLKIEQKICLVVTGPSPSKAGRRYGGNPIYNNYCLQLHAGYEHTTLDFKRFIYQNAVNENFDLLFNLQ